MTDLSRRIVLDVLSDRKKATLITWLKDPPEGIDLSHLAFAATDLWAHYRIVKNEWPILTRYDHT